jgi:hypothetical protein
MKPELDKKLLAKFTKYLFDRDVRFVLVMRWSPVSAEDRITFWLNGPASELRRDLLEVIKEIDDKRDEARQKKVKESI